MDFYKKGFQSGFAFAQANGDKALPFAYREWVSRLASEHVCWLDGEAFERAHAAFVAGWDAGTYRADRPACARAALAAEG